MGWREDVDGGVGLMLNGECLQDLEKTLFTADHLSPYVDATGRPSSGILSGSLAWLGQYEECVELPQARYCLAHMETTIHDTLYNASAERVTWGVCVTSSCNATQVQAALPQIANETLKLPWLKIHEAAVQCGTSVPYSGVFYAAISVLLCLLALCVLGTAMHCRYLHTSRIRYKLVYGITDEGPLLVGGCNDEASVVTSIGDPPDVEPSGSGNLKMPDPKLLEQAFKYKPGQIVTFFTCFSILKNLNKLVSCSPSKRRSILRHDGCADDRVRVAVPCFDGLRVLSMFWVLLAQTFLAMLTAQNVQNPHKASQLSKGAAWPLVSSADMAVNSFLLMGGFLASLACCQRFEKPVKFSCILAFYLHRYFRLVPLLGVVMLIWIGIVPHLASGPQSFNLQTDTNCQHVWWTNLLFIQNIYPASQSLKCMSWLWYLAVDMQLCLITPLLVLLLNRWRRVGLFVLLILLTTGVTITSILIAVYDINVNLAQLFVEGNPGEADKFRAIVFEKPYCRLAPYLIGVGLAWYLFNTSQPTQHAGIKVRQLIGWFVAMVTIAMVIYGPYPAFHGHRYSVAGNAVYGGLSGACWALALTWLITSCINGYAGPVDDLLSWQGWSGLAHLTYAVYLCHPIIISLTCHAMFSTVYISTSTMMVHFLSFCVMSYGAAGILVIIVELPLRNVQRYFSSGQVD